jgi:hypothetical protein
MPERCQRLQAKIAMADHHRRSAPRGPTQLTDDRHLVDKIPDHIGTPLDRPAEPLQGAVELTLVQGWVEGQSGQDVVLDLVHGSGQRFEACARAVGHLVPLASWHRDSPAAAWGR